MRRISNLAGYPSKSVLKPPVIDSNGGPVIIIGYPSKTVMRPLGSWPGSNFRDAPDIKFGRISSHDARTEVWQQPDTGHKDKYPV